MRAVAGARGGGRGARAPVGVVGQRPVVAALRIGDARQLTEPMGGRVVGPGGIRLQRCRLRTRAVRTARRAVRGIVLSRCHPPQPVVSRYREVPRRALPADRFAERVVGVARDALVRIVHARLAAEQIVGHGGDDAGRCCGRVRCGLAPRGAGEVALGIVGEGERAAVMVARRDRFAERVDRLGAGLAERIGDGSGVPGIGRLGDAAVRQHRTRYTAQDVVVRRREAPGLFRGGCVRAHRALGLALVVRLGGPLDAAQRIELGVGVYPGAVEAAHRRARLARQHIEAAHRLAAAPGAHPLVERGAGRALRHVIALTADGAAGGPGGERIGARVRGTEVLESPVRVAHLVGDVTRPRRIQVAPHLRRRSVVIAILHRAGGTPEAIEGPVDIPAVRLVGAGGHVAACDRVAAGTRRYPGLDAVAVRVVSVGGGHQVGREIRLHDLLTQHARMGGVGHRTVGLPVVVERAHPRAFGFPGGVGVLIAPSGARWRA